MSNNVIKNTKRVIGFASTKGFTLIELLVVIAIIGILSSVAFISLRGAPEKAKTVAAVQAQKTLQKASTLYALAMSFYPPDVGRGWDPGFAKPLPYNIDTGQDCAVNPADCPACTWCPFDWVSQVQAKWQGPYIAAWPPYTPWKGKYDYNYWPVGANRYGCTISPGVYIGVQGDYTDQNTIPASAEQDMIDKNLDSDNCLNGESQMLLIKL